ASGKIAIRQQDLKEKMRTKREKRRAMSGKGVRLTSDEEEALRNVDPGSDVATSIVETAQLRESSKERNTESGIYNVLAEIEEDELKDTKAKVLNDLLSKTAMSEEEKRSFVAKFFEQAAEAKEKMDSTREYNQAVLAAKIAARRRMKESLAKEKAMKDEVSALSKKQARMSKDADTVDVLETTEKLMKENLNEKMESLEEEQTVRLEEMEVEHRKDVIHMEEELKNATNRGMSSIEQQMEQQKQK
ncbi:Hypothetical predicted protein, partial [Paramuricea clavata]